MGTLSSAGGRYRNVPGTLIGVEGGRSREGAVLKTATEEERTFYEECLYPLQDRVLARMETDRFYLTGGTCLSRYYYHHRYSDDLDFFYDGHRFLHREFVGTTREFLAVLSREMKIEIPNAGDQFIRAFVYEGDVALKLEFIHEGFPTIGKPIARENFFIDTRENIAVNKVTTIFDRKTVKDYVDLYYLLKDLLLSRCLELAETKIVPLDYEGMLLAFADRRLEGEVLLTGALSEEELVAFVEKLIQEMLDHAARKR